MGRTVDIELSPDARALLDALAAAGKGVALVGGVVRDALLGREIRDLDVVTDASPDDVRAACDGVSWCRRVYAVGERYGTLGVVLDDGSVVEVSQARGEQVTRPAGQSTSASTFAERFAEDAAHRDFTVNAIAALWPSLEVLDPAQGIGDIEARVLRAPGDAAARLAEDPVRVLRAARFCAQLGFAIAPATAAALPAAAPGLAGTAPERVRDELSALLVSRDAEHGLAILRRAHVFEVVLPELAALDGLTQPSFHDLDALSHTIQAVGAAPATPVLRWAALLHDLGKAPSRTVEPNGRIRFFGHARLGAELAGEVCRRLKFSNAERTAIVHLVENHMRLAELPVDNARAVDRAVRRLDLWVRGAYPPRRLVTAEDALELEIADYSATAHRADAPERRRALAAAIAASRERGTGSAQDAPHSPRE